ncbi:MAG: MerR family transcriptional regulator [Chloroflexi bacterium]|nr:MerR family transcriptional regulator [Chloroflexota bacterium]
MLRIGDFARLAQVSIRTLHLYDENSLLKPARIDPFTDYRYYEFEQLPRLNRILALKDLGFTLDQITDFIADDVPLTRVQEMLAHKESELKRQLDEDQARLGRVRARMSQIAEESAPPRYDIIVKSLPAVTIAGVRGMVPDFGQMERVRHDLLQQLYATLAESKLVHRQELTLYHSSEYTETNLEMEQAVVIDSDSVLKAPMTLHAHTLPATTAATLVHHGPFWGVTTAIADVFRWLSRHELASTGSVREVHLFGSELEQIRQHFSQAQIQNEPIVTLEIQLPLASTAQDAKD